VAFLEESGDHNSDRGLFRRLVREAGWVTLPSSEKVPGQLIVVFGREGLLEVVPAQILSHEEGIDPIETATDQRVAVPASEQLAGFETGPIIDRAASGAIGPPRIRPISPACYLPGIDELGNSPPQPAQ
jgi:hypothetical protein